MKTTIYIDGYNLYYGALRNTAYKWLDIVRLFTGICRIQNPHCEVVAVKLMANPLDLTARNLPTSPIGLAGIFGKKNYGRHNYLHSSPRNGNLF